MLGGRPLSFVLKELAAPRNYVALARMARVCEHPLDVGRRYLFGGGEYPFACGVRTPVGSIRPTLFSHHDVWTVNEVFCRGDYHAGEGIATVVDVGSNIGISALYFLTRNTRSRVYLYEPDPRNAERLKVNLAGFGGRWFLEQVAVGPTGGRVSFGREATGRYGGVGVASDDVIDVQCRPIDDVLDSVLAREEAIDVLKVDTEGLEVATIEAIRPELLDRIGTIYFESRQLVPLHEDRFDVSFANETVRLSARNRARP